MHKLLFAGTSATIFPVHRKLLPLSSIFSGFAYLKKKEKKKKNISIISFSAKSGSPI